MQFIRVALVELPQMLADIVSRTIDSQDDMQLVGQYTQVDLENAEYDKSVDILIWCVHDSPESPGLSETVLRRNPHLSIIALTPTAEHGTLHELKPSVTALGEMSPEKILDTVRNIRPVA